METAACCFEKNTVYAQFSSAEHILSVKFGFYYTN